MKNQPESDILLRYVKEESSVDEKAYVEDWIAESSENEEFLLAVSKIYFANRTRERILARDSQQSFAQLQLKIRTRKIRLMVRNVSKVAAILIGVMMLSYFSLKTDFIRDLILEPQLVTLESNRGLRTDFYLPDSTHVWLNSGSTLTYSIPFNRKKQQVMIQGQAYFEVAHDPSRPFTVNVNNTLLVNVLGTKFNVQAYPEEDDVKISLIEGSISVSNPQKAIDELNYLMQVSDEFIYNKSSEKYIVNSGQNTAMSTAWVAGKFIFKDTPMIEVFRQLEHHYNVSFVIKDPIVKQYNFTGTFEHKRLSQILRYIERTSKVRTESHSVVNDDTEKENTEKIYIYDVNK